jgi:hypothetical protein
MSAQRHADLASSPGTDWRLFLRGLAVEIDAALGPERRDALLRATGLYMARLMPLPGAQALNALAIEMNDSLAALGWGRVDIAMSETERCLVLTHFGLPRAGSAGDPPGTWFAAVLEGLYEGWLDQQSGGLTKLTVHRVEVGDEGQIVLHYRQDG